MPANILVAVAWPYANGPLHLGHLAGCYLPADIFARYHRLKGDNVLMVSGSDQHGTPITLRADREGTSPEVVSQRYHADFLRCWDQMGISFDLFTRTGTDNHREVVHEIFTSLYNQGFIYSDVMNLPFCPECKRYLPDRYVEGTCPHCGNTKARGDQCDNCGRTLNPEDLQDARCQISGTTPRFQDSEHLFLKLTAFQDSLLQWITGKDQWRPNVLNFTRRYLEEGLKDRAITRDVSWGIPVPLEGYDDKRIYVWFEAVIGYLSAAKEWATSQGRPDAWSDYWEDPDARSYYFIGKDNIPFHSIIWPAMLMGFGGLNLPYDVPANEFLSLEGQQFSTSRNWAVWLPDYLERFSPEPLRYYLAANMPESGDSDFSWSEYVRRNNDELVATYGNLAHRVLTLTYRNFDGKVPSHDTLDEPSSRMLAQAASAHQGVSLSLEGCRFRAAIQQAMGLAQEANRYLDSRAPWKSLKSDPSEAGTTLWVALSVINCLKTLMYPFLPSSSEELHRMLGFTGGVAQGGWEWEGTKESLPPGQALNEPKPLFVKLEDSVLEQESERLQANLV
ncbi:MAG: methionine--tRNA ligase [Dehalococcoidia bacterium]|nr:methionine--tRNA ligase [Dehalococcoidia bacterium]